MNVNFDEEINVLEFYDPEDDVILPDYIWGEFCYICCILEDIIFNRCDRKQEWFKLKRQIRIFIRWQKLK